MERDLRELNEVHARMYAALMGRKFFSLAEEIEKEKKLAQARELDERRPEQPTLPANAHAVLLEAFGARGSVSVPADAHQRLALALRRF